MDIFVTGGSGFLGQRLVERLVREGHRVVALSRSERTDELLRKLGSTPVRGSLESVEGFESALAGMQAVIHCAAPVEVWGSWDFFERNIVQATVELARATARQGVRRFVYVSSESVMQDRAPLVDVDETLPLPAVPNSYYGLSKKQAEEALAAAGLPLEVQVLRPTFIWGEGCPAFESVLTKVRQGGFVWVDGGSAPFEAVHVDNVVEALVRALAYGKAGTWLVTDGEPTTFRDFWEQIFRALGIPAPRGSAPGWLVRPVASALESIWRAVRKSSPPPLTRFELAFAAMPRRYDISRIRRELGYTPRITRAEGFARLSTQPARPEQRS